MLDKIAFKILGIIAAMNIEGENLVVEKNEILKQLGTNLTFDELDAHLEALEVNDMIAMRYSDSNLYCFALRPKGKMVAEKNRQTEIAAVAAATVSTPAQPSNSDFSEEIFGTEDSEDVESSVPVVVPNFNYKKMGLFCGICAFIGGLLASVVTFIITRFC